MKHHNLKKATIFSIISAFCFSIMALFIKLSAKNAHVNTIIFIRFSISLFYVSMIIFIKNFTQKKISLKTTEIKKHLLRGFLSVATMFLFYYSLKFITLVDGNLLLMTNTLFVPIIGFLLFKHRSKINHWFSIFIGFLGVFLVLRPGHELFNPNALFALFAGITSAMSLLILRKLVKRDNTYTCLFYYYSIAILISGTFIFFYPFIIDKKTFIFLILSGIFGNFYQEFLVRASRHAPAKITSSLMYLSLIFSYILGWIFLAEIPTFLTFIGMVLISIGGILTIQFAKKDIKK